MCMSYTPGTLYGLVTEKCSFTFRSGPFSGGGDSLTDQNFSMLVNEKKMKGKKGKEGKENKKEKEQ